MECHGVPVVTICGGQVVYKDGILHAKPGQGRYVHRNAFSDFVYKRVKQREKVNKPKPVRRAPYGGPILSVRNQNEVMSLENKNFHK
ncbi:dihydropyrimidinase-like [Polypterus senegalus]|nr:dihydropyrimidinase-like [Polypterus senegalus]